CARDRVISRGWHSPFDYW
nr:immunoglobulin heavy chain junction region [Macaca mulatta]MPN83295.1 immunoglobulin heavy chain junction region [Macaca mulatta]MPN83319.1 immunoglobulin heavy chain junction region [Macaca mulatta]MPN83328.1 immunoglobulin heavy chain junction region [Macaca mulatta]MPN83329.1 immunoglobulin heavy chain junction region [Macaca mulatta]